MKTQEIRVSPLGGWGMLGLLLASGIVLGVLFTGAVQAANVVLIVIGSLAGAVWITLMCGYFTLQPNQAAVLVLFGKYVGTATQSGFRWANPLLHKIKVSLRARNLNMQTIKVNDRRGNPVEIAAVVVWRVADTAQAVFDVDNYEHFVSVQSEAALRHVASKYPYDTGDEQELSLRGGMDAVSADLQGELGERLQRAGVVIEEARLSHLAYAPEIAGAMLQRQQAEAIVAARTRIVDGAVGIVEMALEKLEHCRDIKLDEERKATMVNNLLVVLCGDRSGAHPVVNVGTLYS